MSFDWLGEYAQYLDYLRYSPTDMVQFAPRTYYRLFERYNAELWPGQVAALALAALLAFLAFGRKQRGRIAALLLAAAWLFVALAFFHRRYAEIHLGAEAMAAGFALEGLILAAGAIGGRLAFAPPATRRGAIGLALYLVAVLALPLVGPLLGRGWRSIELFALAPDPTALATLALVLALARPPRWPLAILPLAWILVSAATLSGLQATDALVLPGLALLGLLAIRFLPDAAPRGKLPSDGGLG